MRDLELLKENVELLIPDFRNEIFFSQTPNFLIFAIATFFISLPTGRKLLFVPPYQWPEGRAGFLYDRKEW